MESARPRRIAASRGLGLRGGSGKRALTPSAPLVSEGLSAANEISSSGWRDIARVHDAIARLNGSFGASAFPAGLRLLGILMSRGGIGAFVWRRGAFTLFRHHSLGLQRASPRIASMKRSSASRRSVAKRRSARISSAVSCLPVNGKETKASGISRADMVASVSRKADCA